MGTTSLLDSRRLLGNTFQLQHRGWLASANTHSSSAREAPPPFDEVVNEPQADAVLILRCHPLVFHRLHVHDCGGDRMAESMRIWVCINWEELLAKADGGGGAC